VLRASFDQDAELYDRVRPRYPPALFDELVGLAGLPAAGRVLEIGCGTGQATLPLARRGYQVRCVELGANMARVARRNLRDCPDASVEVSAFEEWELSGGPYDLVLAATCWHWIDPDVRFRKAAAALRPGGALALVGTAHVSDGRGDAFFARAQEVYVRCEPETAGQWTGLPAATAGGPPEVDRELFGPPAFRRFPWSASYDARRYVDVLNTYSGHRTLPDGQRECLYGGIAGLIDAEFGGRIEKRYLFTLAVARLLPVAQPRL